MISAFTPVATLAVTDPNRAHKFYEDTLGLTKEREEEGGAFYKCGAGQLFVYPSQYAGTNKATAVTFTTDDNAKFDATVAELEKKGVSFMTFEYEGITWNGNVATMGEMGRGVWFTDPDGNILNISVGM
jgi:catechol 2,3-dioxygenase-like lactoylglutathione lyase family enzyme